MIRPVQLWEGTDGKLVLACPLCNSDIPVTESPMFGFIYRCPRCRHSGVISGKWGTHDAA